MTPEARIADAMIDHGRALSTSPAVHIVSSDEAGYKPSPGVEYVALKLFVNGTNTLFVGDTSSLQYQGILQMTVVYPIKAGILPALELAGQVAQHFKKGTMILGDGVKIKIDRAPSASTPFDDGGWTRVPVSIPYHCMVKPVQ